MKATFTVIVALGFLGLACSPLHAARRLEIVPLLVPAVAEELSTIKACGSPVQANHYVNHYDDRSDGTKNYHVPMFGLRDITKNNRLESGKNSIELACDQGRAGEAVPSHCNI
jgi:hypothetical protein